MRPSPPERFGRPVPEKSGVQFSSPEEFQSFIEVLDAGEVSEEFGEFYLPELSAPFARSVQGGVEVTEAGQIHLVRLLHTRSHVAQGELSELLVPEEQLRNWRQQYLASQDELVGEALQQIRQSGKADEVHQKALERQVALEVARIRARQRLTRWEQDRSR
jgi:hypothetical protein